MYKWFLVYMLSDRKRAGHKVDTLDYECHERVPNKGVLRIMDECQKIAYNIPISFATKHFHTIYHIYVITPK